MNNSIFSNIDKGIKFTYCGHGGFHTDLAADHRICPLHEPYSVVAKTPEELYEAMKSWHAYGSEKRDMLTPSEWFKKQVEAIFGVGEGWEDKQVKCNGRVSTERYIKKSQCGNYIEWVEVKTILRTTGCGAWSIVVEPA